MRYFALATDYDGTLAHHGSVSKKTLQALEKVKKSGRKLILVTGRQLDDLKEVFPELPVFDYVVAENGALLYNPVTKKETALGAPPPDKFVVKLEQKKVEPLSVGRVIVATWEPHQHVVLELIKEMGLEHQVIFNKGAIMVLPPGINKAAGLAAALKEMKLSHLNIAAIGDAENDNTLLEHSGFSAAVANALPSVKEKADMVTAKDHGEGVCELLEMMVRTDLFHQEEKKNRHLISVGNKGKDIPYLINPLRNNILLAGTSGSGKSTLSTAILEKLYQQSIQFCLIDPEGDYTAFPHGVIFGDASSPPLQGEVIKILEQPDENVIVNTLAISLADRPAFFRKLFSALTDLRLHYGRPHCIIVDEAHHMLPADLDESLLNVPEDLYGIFLVTTKPDRLNKAILRKVDSAVIIGHSPQDTLKDFADKIKIKVPLIEVESLPQGEALVWEKKKPGEISKINIDPPQSETKRHQRKYGIGELGEDNSFYFKGPENKLNLRAQNLTLFIQIADGLDEETWMYHLKKHDYSNWFRNIVKDEKLASETEQVEHHTTDFESSKKEIRQIIEKYYSA